MTELKYLPLILSYVAKPNDFRAKKNVNSSLYLGQVALKFSCPKQVLVCSVDDLVSENKKKLAQKENLLVWDNGTALSLSPGLILEFYQIDFS